MKRFMLLLALVACVGLVANLAWSQEGTAPPKEKPKKEEPKKAQLPENIAKMVKTLNLSEEKVKGITDLVEASKKAVNDWEAANREKIQAAKAAVSEAEKELRTLQAGAEDLRKKLHTDVMALLSLEEKAKWYEAQALEMIGREFRKAELTADQQAKAKEAWVKVSAGVSLDDPKAFKEAVGKLTNEVEKSLTDAQKEAMKKKEERKEERKPEGKTVEKPAEGK